MKQTNRGRTSLRCRRRRANPMAEYDNLPGELRTWLAAAILPWGPKSVRRAYDQALSQTQNTGLALQELDRLQTKLVAKDAARIWGYDHPSSKVDAQR